ncbi:Rieske 2Fe-2S domain-containing protein, partial [Piscinibacter sp.]|uniref:Rieske 2Fe-2S domain-containing protein n=1 Tax=Piscinibacter sp. TaxID=1903157 RepID=UPI0037837D7B
PIRALKSDDLVLFASCTHLGCLPKQHFTPGDVTISPDWPGGFFCPCHGSTFDGAGRVFRNKPAPTNLEIPPHRYLSETRLLIGEGGAA